MYLILGRAPKSEHVLDLVMPDPMSHPKHGGKALAVHGVYYATGRLIASLAVHEVSPQLWHTSGAIEDLAILYQVIDDSVRNRGHVHFVHINIFIEKFCTQKQVMQETMLNSAFRNYITHQCTKK